MEKGENGKQAIPKLDDAIVISVCLFHFSPFPFFLVTHAITSLG
jgi:hypothetical protein